ncbi:MAG TPA: type ISP restriction/modification enzyme [Desulfatiglandales bacterium]|nr:type ISP restriction/modification enzyme [Desulfatiglandales bacterium]
MSIQTYLKSIERQYQAGNATEHTYRPALKTLLEELHPELTATNEPKREKCGAPDYIVTKGQLIIGYIEAKDVGKNLDEIEKTEQLKRYFDGLQNLILTDYLEFRIYQHGELIDECRLGRFDPKGKLRKSSTAEETFASLCSKFKMAEITRISSPKDLAERMASVAQIIKEVVTHIFADEDDLYGELHDQYKAFKEILVHDLMPQDFADMFAQTVTYGLFAARCNHKGKIEDFTREKALFEIPKTNPFLLNLFSRLAGPELDVRLQWIIDHLAELLAQADMASILSEFGNRTEQEDPVVHFYETFLSKYDPELREVRGVFYTPEPVVSYIVRSVDYILKKDFDISDGLASSEIIHLSRLLDDQQESLLIQKCHKVLILDPAVGTGTFIHSVIDHIHDTIVRKGQAGLWDGYVSEHLLPRLFGFELLMAPYAVAHLKLGLQLKEFGYSFSSDERLRIYLTNSLERAFEQAQRTGYSDMIVREASAASEVKTDYPVMVIIGNPPYSGHSANKGKWIKDLLRGKGSGAALSPANYFHVDGEPLGERNPKWLNDDYVKFIRFAHWRIERTGYGILAFITNHSYLDNPTFRGMRQSLLNFFDEIYILNLHGNIKRKEKAPDGSKDENVFDIQQGVTISIFIKNKTGDNSINSIIHYADLWGDRKITSINTKGEHLTGGKYYYLYNNDIASTEWKTVVPKKPFYLFIPYNVKLLNEYEIGWKTTDIFLLKSVGIVTARDKLTIHFKKESIWETVKKIISLSPERAREELLIKKDTIDWKMGLAQDDLKDSGPKRGNITTISYRPFDQRLTYYTGKTGGFMCRPRSEVMFHMLNGNNYGLITARSNKSSSADHFFCTNFIMEAKCGESTTQSYLFPLYRYTTEKEGDHISHNLISHLDSKVNYERKPNLSTDFVDVLSSQLDLCFINDGQGNLKTTVGPEDIFHFIYAIVNSPSYRERYKEYLRIDFPRIPLCSDRQLFKALCALGRKLTSLHLMKERVDLITSFAITGDNFVENVRYEDNNKRVYINKTQYFDNVPIRVWDFYIGGYQVCHKWLKDRKGRQLTYDDLTHYQRIVTILDKTIHLMQEIDELIDRHGGWPIR